MRPRIERVHSYGSERRLHGRQPVLETERKEVQLCKAKFKLGESAIASNIYAGSNKNVDDALNQAEIQFRDGEKELACRWAGNAIGAANSDYGGPPSANQKEQLKAYARRCNLRY